MKIFYDVDTQNDFMNKDGALYVPGAESIKPNLKKLTQYAIKDYIPIVGSVDKHHGIPEYKHREWELQRWGGPFPDHCMNGTQGEEKITETTTEKLRLKDEHLPEDLFSRHFLDDYVHKEFLKNAIKEIKQKSRWKAGLYFEKQSYDVFTNHSFEEFLKIADVKEAVVYGVATDYCVKAAVLGMQKRGIQCYVVKDAIKGVTPETTKQALEEMVKAGARFIKTKEVLENKLRW